MEVVALVTVLTLVGKAALVVLMALLAVRGKRGNRSLALPEAAVARLTAARKVRSRAVC